MAKTAKKVNTIESPIQAAEAVIADLESKRAALIAARAEDDRQMASVSYRAHAHGDAEANDQLDAFVESALRHEQQIKSLDAALATAHVKLAESQAAESAEAERLAMTELLGLCKVLREAGQQADDALNVLGDAAGTLGDTIGAINRLGVTHPSSLQLQSLGERAIKTALIEHPWARGFEHVPPAERRSFASFTSEWAKALEQSINHKLNQLNKGSSAKTAA